jgi:beta-lactam-binding protein with PASTA domain
MPRQKVARRVDSPAEPRLLDDRYRLQDVVGRGGMATVYRALDTTLARTVAVKVLHPELAREPQFVERFLEMELRIARLFHPHIVTVFDAGTQEDECFVVMEYVAGGSLRDAMIDQGPLPLSEAIRIAGQVADGLHALHAERLAHGDVKPENVLIDETGSVKLADFGIAHLATTTGSFDSRNLASSALYLSPEQLDHGRADERSDQYSLGLMLYEMVTGRLPFAGESWVAATAQRLTAIPPPPSSVRRSIPASMDRVIMRTLERDPARRYESMAQLRSALARATAGMAQPVERATNESGAGRLSPATSERNGADPGGSATDLALRPPARTQGARPGRRRMSLRPTGPLAWAAVGLLIAGLAIAALRLPGAINPPRTVRAPDLGGQQLEAGRAAANAAGVTIQSEEEWTDSAPKGTVLRQEPPPNTAMQSDRPLRLVVSGGPPPVRVPHVEQRRLEEARTDLAAAGLALGRVDERETKSEPWGVVYRQGTKPGGELPRGATVDVTLAVPPSTIAPRLAGLALGEAESRLRRDGLKLGQVKLAPVTDKPAGTVVQQDPAPDIRLRHGERVAVEVAVPPEALSR